MKSLKVFLEKPETIISLAKPWKISGEFLSVKSGFIFWNWNNIQKDIEIESIDSGNTVEKIVFKKGYWTLAQIVDALKSNGIKCKPNVNNLVVEISPAVGKTLKLKDLGKYLGFPDVATVISKKTKSGLVDVNLGLKYINIECSAVNREQTFFNGKPSRILFTVPVTSTQTLKGSVEHFSCVRSLLNLDSGVYNEFRFAVVDNFGKEIEAGSIMLDLEIL